MIAQTDDDSFQANNVTRVLGERDYGTTIRFL